MKILIAPDSFKDCLDAQSIGEHFKTGLLKANPNHSVRVISMADGGEGFVTTMLQALGGKSITIKTEDALKRSIKASYGIVEASKTAIIEMAAASGIEHISNEDKNPLIASTFGTGELILDALKNGCKKIIIGIGGSATNDGGTGMAKALGYKFLDKNNKELDEGGGFLNQLHKIDISEKTELLNDVEIVVACDVANPLTGTNGATAIYGPQKGVTNETLKLLDNNLEHLGNLIKEQLNIDVLNIEGAGAAGGLGAGLMAFTNASLKTGFDIVKSETNLENAIQESDLIITGEGKIDRQTQNGKTPFGIAKIASKYHKPTIGIAGYLGNGYQDLYQCGFTAIFALANGPITLEESIINTPKLLIDLGYKIGKMLEI